MFIIRFLSLKIKTKVLFWPPQKYSSILKWMKPMFEKEDQLFRSF